MLSDVALTCILPITDLEVYHSYCEAMRTKFPNWTIIRPVEGLPIISTQEHIKESRHGIFLLLDELKEPQNVTVACFSDLHAEEIRESYPHLNLWLIGQETWKAVQANGEKFVVITIGEKGDLEPEFRSLLQKVDPDLSLLTAVVGLGHTLSGITEACWPVVKEWRDKGITCFVLGCTGMWDAAEFLEEKLLAEGITGVKLFEPHACLAKALNEGC